MALLPKGGLNVAGHKIPWEAVAAVAAVVSVILVVRARQSGGNVASVGTPVNSPFTAAGAGFGNFSPDFTGQLANITEQLTSIEQQLNAPATPGGTTNSQPGSGPQPVNPPSFKDPANRPADRFGGGASIGSAAGTLATFPTLNPT